MKGLIVGIFILLGVALTLASLRNKKGIADVDDTKQTFINKAKSSSGSYDIPASSQPLIPKATPHSTADVKLSGDSIAEYANSVAGG